MSGGGSSDKTSKSDYTTNQWNSATTTPPTYALDYAKPGLETSQVLGNMPESAFPFYNRLDGSTGNVYDFPDTVANLNDSQIQSLQKIYEYANADNPVMNNALSSLSDTLSGKYLSADSNPYLSDYVDQAMSDVTRSYETSTIPQLNAAASRAGAFGGSTDALLKSEAMQNLGDSLSKTATNIYYPAYQAERNLMTSAQQYAPTAIQMPLTMQTAALGVGDVYQQQEQAELNDLLSKWQQSVYWPYFASGAGADLFSKYGWGSQSDATNVQNTAGYGTSSGGSSGGSGLGTGLGILGTTLGLASSIFGKK